MTETPRRNWFRFSLRTLLLVVTALSCYLAWESSIVRNRKAILKEVRGHVGLQVSTADEWQGRYPHDLPARAPLVRRLLGDQAIQEISVMRAFPDHSDQLLSRFQKAFPEAAVREIHPEPCHPGCFPHGTPVGTPQGLRPVESLETGNSVLVISPSGESVTAQVQSVFKTRNRLWEVLTDDGALLTTETQPLCVALNQARPAGELQIGDRLLRFRDGQIRSVSVLAVTPTDRTEPVVNLVLGNCEVFVAGGFLARSKPPADSSE